MSRRRNTVAQTCAVRAAIALTAALACFGAVAYAAGRPAGPGPAPADAGTGASPRREAVGKKHVAYLRGEGQIAAVVYGMGGESVSVQVNHQEMTTHLRHRVKVFKL